MPKSLVLAVCYLLTGSDMKRDKNSGSTGSVIPRYPVSDRAIVRKSAPTNFREEDEVAAAYAQVGDTPNRNTKSWYRDIYEFYQNNEC